MSNWIDAENEKISEEVSALFSTNINTIGLPTRSYNALVGAGVKTIRDLVQHTPTQLRKIPNLGKASYIEITGILKDLGLALGMASFDREKGSWVYSDKYNNDDEALCLESKLFELRADLNERKAAKVRAVESFNLGINEVENEIKLLEGQIEDYRFRTKLKRTMPVGQVELRKEIACLKKELKAVTIEARQMYAANMRFNMATYKEIGEALGVSTNRARQIYMKQLSDLVNLEVIDRGKL